MAEDTNNENLETSGLPAEGEGTEVKTFTQAEVDNIVARRVARATKGMPSQDELNEFREWQKSHNDSVITNLTNERDTAKNALLTAQAELETMKREKILLSKGINADDIDYYIFKIGKMVDDKTTFEQATDAFLAENGNKGNKVTVDLASNLDGGKKTTNPNNVMNNLIRGIK